MIINGEFVFNLKNEKGLDFSMIFDKIINEEKHLIDWQSFVNRAKTCGWQEYQIYDSVLYGLQDAEVDKNIIKEILNRLRMLLIKTINN